MTKHTPDNVTYVPATEADRERIDACFLACTGIPTSALSEGCVDRLADRLRDMISAARGMPISYDNLCQGTLDHAIELAEAELDRFDEEDSQR